MSFLLGGKDRGWPFSIFYEGDAEVFYNYAQSILAGVPYDNGIPFHPPLFPIVLAGLHAVLGNPVPHALLRALLAVASATLAPLLYLWARDRFGRPAALAAGLLTAFSFGLDMIGVSATSETLYLLLALLLLRTASDPSSDQRRGGRQALASGLLGGALALTRAEGIATALAVLALGTIGLARTNRRAALRWGALAAGGLCLALLPWTVRNAVVLQRWNQTAGARIGTHLPTFVPITAYGPLNFALANNDLATGEFQRRILTSGSDVPVLDLADPQHRHFFLQGNREGLQWIVANPGRFLSLAARKLDLWSRAFDLGWTPWNFPHGRTGTRRPVDVFAPDHGGLRILQLALAVAGLALAARRTTTRKHALALGAPVLASLAACVLFFGYVRLGMIASLFLFVAEGIALAALIERLPRGLRAPWSRPRLIAACAAGAIALLVFGALQNRNYIASGSTNTPGGKLLPDAPMHISPTP